MHGPRCAWAPRLDSNLNTDLACEVCKLQVSGIPCVLHKNDDKYPMAEGECAQKRVNRTLGLPARKACSTSCSSPVDTGFAKVRAVHCAISEIDSAAEALETFVYMFSIKAMPPVGGVRH